jgi:Cu-Zn family superoxide dismutase
MKPLIKVMFVFVLALSFMNTEAQEKKTQKAVCELNALGGSNVSGTVTFTVVKDGLKIVADVKGLSPGKHGFHIHEGTDCDKPGGHFNPVDMRHGAPPDMMRHTGDMGNLVANSSGKAHYEYVDNMISFEGKNSIIGRVIIIHAHEDDLVGQPSGNSGQFVACGKIEMK